MRNWLLEFFKHKLIALYHESECPARSPDIEPLRLLPLGYSKNIYQVFRTPPHTIAEPRQIIITEVDAVKRNRMLVRRSVRNMLEEHIGVLNACAKICEEHAPKSTFVY